MIQKEEIWFDRYLVLSEIGRGSGSKVYLVKHQKLGEYRAVKCISKHSESAWQIREANILNHLKHPRIPVLYDVEEDDDFFYLIEEYIEGESLEAAMLHSSIITLKFIYQTVLETAEVLNYLHEQKPSPVIYQDLKAEHIILSRQGVKLIDFGITSYLKEEGNNYCNYGTPEYCAPEKTNGAKISVLTDVYSLGKLLEQLICADASKESLCLWHIAEKATASEENRYRSIQEFQKEFVQTVMRAQSEKNPIYQKHLLKKIVVVGSEPHIGATHAAISFTEYLNQYKINAVYLEKNKQNALRKTAKARKDVKEKQGIFRKGKFVGMPLYGDGVSVEEPKNVCFVEDFGTDVENAVKENADLCIVVMGSRPWEQERTREIVSFIGNRKQTVLLSNYGDEKQAKSYAAEFQRAVYCFPLDKNPFCLTREKETLFGRLLEKEGGEIAAYAPKSNRNCRKYPRLRRNAFWDSVGKLYRIRFGRKNGLC